MRIVVDAMGGDSAPDVVLEGAVAAARGGTEVTLVGPAALIQPRLDALPGRGAAAITVVDAPEVIAMDEHPASAVRQKRNSSIVVGLRLLKEGQGDAFYSAGNSGAVMAGAIFTLGRIEGADRPAIGIVLPLRSGRCFLADAGANADCEPAYLLQFAQMGSAYMAHVFGMTRPRVGLVSIGEEETKGNALVLQTIPLLKQSGLNFVGNVEGKDITRGAADVVICDGFTGNVILKLAEGMQELILGLVREAVQSKLIYQAAGAVLRPALRAAARRLDYAEYGGAPLIGVRGAVFIGHGRSNARAIANGIRTAAEATRGDLVGHLRASLTTPVSALPLSTQEH